MSIATKKGDDGSTGLMFNRRVTKNHPRVEAYGSCDELNVALGNAKALLKSSHPNGTGTDPLIQQIHDLQITLVVLMGELAVLPEDRERYEKTKRFINRDDVARLTSWVDRLESENISFDGWATPGENTISVAFDQARVICRRAERRVYALGDEVRDTNPEVIRFLNRLSDVLWLLARKTERPF